MITEACDHVAVVRLFGRKWSSSRIDDDHQGQSDRSVLLPLRLSRRTKVIELTLNEWSTGASKGFGFALFAHLTAASNFLEANFVGRSSHFLSARPL